MRMLAKVVVGVAFGVLGSACGDGCGKEKPIVFCQTNGPDGSGCPEGQQCIYDPGVDPQDPMKFGECKTVEEFILCKNLAPCLNPHAECGFNASFCDENDRLTLCECQGPHPKEEPTGGQSEAKK